MVLWITYHLNSLWIAQQKLSMVMKDAMVEKWMQLFGMLLTMELQQNLNIVTLQKHKNAHIQRNKKSTKTQNVHKSLPTKPEHLLVQLSDNPYQFL